MFFLAGGPGQGAAKLARMVREMFRRVQTDRDIVLVDQRGTGKSNPLNCESDDDSLKTFNEPEAAGLDRLKKCMSGYDADLTLYTTTIAMDDLDDVRAHLGYDRINIYGGSYGTRAGLVYMRQHGDRVRAAVLDGVAPTNMRLPLYFPRDVQRALDLLVKDCENDEPCRTTYPNLGQRIRDLMERLRRDPPLVKVTHPRTGETGEVRLEPRLVANVIASTLYSPLVSALIPAVVARAEQNDFQGMLALATLGDGGEPNMSIGMQLSVICAEDAPRVTAEDAEKESKGTLFGEYVMRNQRLACEFWPQRHGRTRVLRADHVERFRRWCCRASSIRSRRRCGASRSPRPCPASKHIVIPGTGHTAGGTGCGLRIIRNFIDKGTTEGLDTSCVALVHRPPFFVSPAGPDPTVHQPVRRSPAGHSAEGRRRMIRVENLHKRFGDVRAVDGVSFTAPDGKVTGLLGPNGAGKTTTLRMLYTLMRPDEGRILVDDVDAVADPEGARKRLGVLPDQSGLYPRLTAREHIHYFGELQGITGRDLATRTGRPAEDARHDRHRRSPHRRLLARRAHQDRAGPRHRAQPGQRAARRAHQRARRDEHARGARHHPPPQGGRPHRAVLEPRDAGSLGALRHHRRDRARPDRGVGHARRPASRSPASRTSKTRSWP